MIARNAFRLRKAGGLRAKTSSRVPGEAAAAASGILTLTTLTAAQAAPAPLTDPAKAAAIADQLGNKRTVGIYYRNERLVVAVTDQAAAETVRSAGAVAEVVPHSTAELGSAKAQLDQLAGIRDTAWSTDQISNRVNVQIYDGVSDADRSRIEKAVSRYGDAVKITEHSGKIEIDRLRYARRPGRNIGIYLRWDELGHHLHRRVQRAERQR
ncbi:alpha-lytic protease prodomain-containing protein [Streptomyces sp. NPDC093261]|uniref:alpha-lytic protease prodomain-containing protein n=1 Tax=Streptomyces sp. NPDC093261 TaxID=3366037 RepID=UPI003827758E